MSQAARYEAFCALHAQPGAFVMPNVWDGGSAVLMKQAGFAALASSSVALAFSLGRQDGCHAVSRDEAVAHAALLADLTDLPVNGDLEDGFGPAPDDCVATVEAAIARGLAGLGIEDTTANPAAPIHDFDAAVARLRAAAHAAQGRILLTGRTDLYLNGRPDLDETIRRLVAFAEVGADVLFAPGLPDMASICAVVRAVAPKPVNVVVGPGDGAVPVSMLAKAGVKRISLGGVLQRCAYEGLLQAARLLAAGDIPAALPRLSTAQIAGLLPGGTA